MWISYAVLGLVCFTCKMGVPVNTMPDCARMKWECAEHLANGAGEAGGALLQRSPLLNAIAVQAEIWLENSPLSLMNAGPSLQGCFQSELRESEYCAFSKQETVFPAAWGAAAISGRSPLARPRLVFWCGFVQALCVAGCHRPFIRMDTPWITVPENANSKERKTRPENPQLGWAFTECPLGMSACSKL